MARALVKEIKDTRKNYIINGDMRISQRGTLFTSIASGAYCLDRYVYGKSGAMVHSIAQDTDVPTSAQANYAFKNSLLATVTTVDASIAAGDFCVLVQKVEGYNWANLAEKPFTLGFWVKATTTGTYCVGFRNSGSDRSYVAEYTINATNTWEYKSIPVLASPSSGTWNYTNGTGLEINWVLAAGTTYHTATPNSWQTGLAVATANQVNGTQTIAASFRLTGITLNEGSYVAPFKLFGEDFGGELIACQRYYEKNNELGTFQPTSIPADTNNEIGYRSGGGSTQRINTYYKVEKRAQPSVTFYDLVGNANRIHVDGANNVAGGLLSSHTKSFQVETPGASVLMRFHWISSAEL